MTVRATMDTKMGVPTSLTCVKWKRERVAEVVSFPHATPQVYDEREQAMGLDEKECCYQVVVG